MAVTHEGKGLATEVATIGPAAEAVAGLAIIVLAILGLANIAPQSLAAIAAIVTGAALLLQVTNTAAEYAGIMTPTRGEVMHIRDVGSGVSAGFLAGGAGIVLGILALVDIGTMHLIAAALIVFGGAWLLGAGVAAATARHRLATVATDPMGHGMVQQAVAAAAGAQALIGLTSVILGILALMAVPQIVLILVAFLALGGSLLLTGAATAGTVATLRRH
jgi:hypothetical protein